MLMQHIGMEGTYLTDASERLTLIASAIAFGPSGVETHVLPFQNAPIEFSERLTCAENESTLKEALAY